MNGFGSNAVIDQEFQMTSEERMRYSLATPGARGAMTTTAVNRVTKARIQYNLALLAHDLHNEVIGWIRDVAKTNPKQAVELYMSFLEFSVPKLKSVELTQHGSSGPLKDLTIEELQRLAAEANTQ